MSNVLHFFLVRRADGHYLTPGGWWSDKIKNAKVYNKIGPARGRVTYWAKHYGRHDPTVGIPEIIVFEATEKEVLNEEERVKEAIG